MIGIKKKNAALNGGVFYINKKKYKKKKGVLLWLYLLNGFLIY
jgi:hypothetical protein